VGKGYGGWSGGLEMWAIGICLQLFLELYSRVCEYGLGIAKFFLIFCILILEIEPNYDN
jgi:hypothetical protein